LHYWRWTSITRIIELSLLCYYSRYNSEKRLCYWEACEYQSLNWSQLFSAEFSFRFQTTNAFSLFPVNSSLVWLCLDFPSSLLANSTDISQLYLCPGMPYSVYPVATYPCVSGFSIHTIYLFPASSVNTSLTLTASLFLVVLTHSLYPVGRSGWLCVLFSRSCCYNSRCIFFQNMSRFDCDGVMT
jgi:hypothetical protein